jgi:hypothetical protein
LYKALTPERHEEAYPVALKYYQYKKTLIYLTLMIFSLRHIQQ